MMVNGSRRMSGQPSDPASQVIVGCKPEDWCFAKDCRCKPDVTNKKPLGIAPSCSEMGITCESGELRPTPWTSSAQARLKLAVECTGSEDRKSSLQSGTRPGFHKEWRPDAKKAEAVGLPRPNQKHRAPARLELNTLETKAANIAINEIFSRPVRLRVTRDGSIRQWRPEVFPDGG
jgi:hypothetical protein